MINIKLLNHSGKIWRKFGDSRVKGFAFDGDELLFEEQLLHIFLDAIRQNLLSEILLRLNGNFSAVIRIGDTVYLISDKLRSYPLLYIFWRDGYLVTDHPKVILEKCSGIKIDERAVPVYLTCGYLHDDMTLLEGCRLVMAGSFVRLLDGGKSEIHHYHHHIHLPCLMTEQEIIKGGSEALEKSFQRMLRSIGNRQVFIPLSGGYDSRLIACLCKKLDVQNVSCYTYGDKASYEVAISQKVAQRLGFPWHFVEYTHNLSEEHFFGDLSQDYRLFASNLNTTAHFQDFMAIYELRRKGVIPDDAVVVPGHSGDLLAGSHIPYGRLTTEKSVAELVACKYFFWNDLKKKYRKEAISGLGKQLNETIASHNPDVACSLFDNWNIQNRQSNYIVNSVRIYEFFGLDWRLPLWDDEYAEFWLSVGWKQKREHVYDSYMFRTYFKPFDVAFYKPKQISTFARLQLPLGLKSVVKYWLCVHSARFRKYYDVNNTTDRIEMLKQGVDKRDMQYIKWLKPQVNAMSALNQLRLLRSKLIE